MKCQKCNKPATFHITELTGDEVVAVHLCADCAEVYLKTSEPDPEQANFGPSNLAEIMTQQIKLGQTADELSRLDKKACPVCGISFYEFRQSGRLGCPHDYVFFAEELEPLLKNIHGSIQHTGKSPKTAVAIDPDVQTELIRLRREMKEAIESEDYERASTLRDQIKGYEGK